MRRSSAPAVERSCGNPGAAKKKEVYRTMAVSLEDEVRSAEERFELEILERKRRLDRAFRNLEALMERTERRMTAALLAISEIRRARQLARHLEAESEEDSESDRMDYPPPLRLSAAALPLPSSTGSTGGSRNQRSTSLENFHRLLSERGIQLGADFSYRDANCGRKSRTSSSTSSRMNPGQRLKY